MGEAEAPTDALTQITLHEVTADTVRAVCELRVAPDQEGFVAPNAVSIAEAHFEENAWFRAIYAGDTLVGFIMLDDDAENRKYFLWRLMIAAGHQGKGYGAGAVRRLIEYVRTRPGARELLTSYVPGEGSPEGFYRKLGFGPTGEVEDGEITMRLHLS